MQCTQGVTRGTSDLMAADHRVRGLHGDPAGSAGFALQLVFDDFGFQLGQFADPSETKPGRFEQVTARFAGVLLECDLHGFCDFFRAGCCPVFERANAWFSTWLARVLFGLVTAEWRG